MSPAYTVFAGIDAADLSTTSPSYLTTALQQQLNGYLYGSYNPPMFIGSSFENFTNNRTSPVTVSIWTTEYQCNAGWVFVYFTASLVMLSAAVMGAILNHKSNAPDILGYCSSLVKDNPYIRGSGVGSAMTGFARTKFYGGLRLRLVDVEGENKRGHIALAEDDGRHGRLKPRSGRLYIGDMLIALVCGAGWHWQREDLMLDSTPLVGRAK